MADTDDIARAVEAMQQAGREEAMHGNLEAGTRLLRQAAALRDKYLNPHPPRSATTNPPGLWAQTMAQNLIKRAIHPSAPAIPFNPNQAAPPYGGPYKSPLL